MSELKPKPCPHCGSGKAQAVVTSSEITECEECINTDFGYYTVVCDASSDNKLGGCGAQSGYRKTKEEAIEEWNTRAAEQQSLDTLKAEIADPLQYKIDELMLEYCPDEMTDEQLENWKSHQGKYQSSANESQINSKAEDK